MKVEKIICDVCRDRKARYENQPMQVIFTTEQEEGRTCKPYFSIENLDLCEHCFGEAIEEGKYLHATGAMGYTDYRFKQ